MKISEIDFSEYKGILIKDYTNQILQIGKSANCDVEIVMSKEEMLIAIYNENDISDEIDKNSISQIDEFDKLELPFFAKCNYKKVGKLKKLIDDYVVLNQLNSETKMRM